MYTFQLLLISDEFQFDLWGEEFKDAERLKEKKTEIFKEMLMRTDIPFIQHHKPSTKLLVKVLGDFGDFSVMKIAVKREIQHFDFELREYSVDSFPYVTVIFHWPTQTLAIGKQATAFQDTDIVASIIRHNADRRLQQFNLSTFIETKFEAKTFWEQMAANKGNVTSLKFELVSPNLPDISSHLPDELKELQKKTRSHQAILELKGGENSTLKIEESDSDIKGLVDYAGEGGGKITFRTKGVKTVQKSGTVTRTISLDETVLEGDADKVALILREIFQVNREGHP